MTDNAFYNDIANLAEANAPLAPDDNQTRYGISLLFDIPLINQSHDFFFGDYNKKELAADGVRRINVENRAFFPRLVLMPFVTTAREIPAEDAASFVRGSYEDYQANFDASEWRAAQKNAVRVLRKTAKQCAETVQKKYGSSGFCLLDALTGKSTAEAFRLSQIVFPAQDASVFPKSERVAVGYRVSSPFLDEIYEFLNANAIERINALSESEAESRVLEAMRQRLLVACNTISNHGNAVLDQTEAEMQSANPVKSKYDAPNYEVWDASAPPDLVYLAHLKRVPLSDKQIAAAKEMSKDVSEPVRDAVNALTQALSGFSSATPGSNTLSPELLAQIKAAVKEEVKAELLAENAAPSPAKPIVTTRK